MAIVDQSYRATKLATVLLSAATFSALAFSTSAFAQKTPQSAAPAEPPAMQPKDDRSEVQGTIKMAHVHFVSPKDGDTVKREFPVKFAVEGMKVTPAGEITPGTGHFHILVDSPVVKKGEVIGTDDKRIHFGKGQTETILKLAPGKHTLTLLFADGAHRSYGEMMSQTITITVK